MKFRVTYDVVVTKTRCTVEIEAGSSVEARDRFDSMGAAELGRSASTQRLCGAEDRIEVRPVDVSEA